MMRPGSSRSLAALRHLAVGELGAGGGEALRRPAALWRRVAALLLRRGAECTPPPSHADRVGGSAGRLAMVVARVSDAVFVTRPERGRGARRRLRWGSGSAGSMPVGVCGPTRRHLGELEGGADDSDSEWGGRTRKIR